jgi:hypothetical protein
MIFKESSIMKKCTSSILFLLILFIFSCDENESSVPVINNFSASPASVSEGENVTLSWDVSNADTIMIDNNIGSVEPIGSRTFTLNEAGTYTYTLTARNGSESVTASVTVVCVNRVTKLQPSTEGIYHSAFVFQGNEGWEDTVTRNEVTDFEALVGKQLVWAYFSNNWFSGITFPAEGVNTLKELGRIPFIRLMARHEDAWENPGGETLFTMQNIINGMFDNELRTWARAARDCGIPLLVEFGTEVNGEWFPWNGKYHGGGTLNGYGDPNYPDGPERFRDAYRHIIQLFRDEGADNITWFFHVNNSNWPNEEWNQYSYYYPGDDYIDWIGVSVYGPQTPDSDYETFTSLMDVSYPMLSALSADKPIALLEFSICEGSWSKKGWITDAFDSIAGGRYPRLKAISWWNEKWENSDGSWSDLTVDSSVHSLEAYRNGVANAIFISAPVFSGRGNRIERNIK